MPEAWNQLPQTPKMPNCPQFPKYPEYPPLKPKEPPPANVPEGPVLFEEEEETFEDLLDDLSDENLDENLSETTNAPEAAPEEEIEEIEPFLPEDEIQKDEIFDKPLDEPLNEPILEEITEEPLFEEPILEEPVPIKDSKQADLSRVVDLLGALHGLTEALPEKHRNSYSQGKLQPALESVIDSLRNLTIIKESTVDVATATNEESCSKEKRGVPNGS
jgi:hypothetical protein